MEKISYENYKTRKIPSKLSENIENIRNIMDNSSDLLVNRFEISGHSAVLITCEGMLSIVMLSQLVFDHITTLDLGDNSSPQDIFDSLQNKTLMSLDRIFIDDYDKLMRMIMSGFAVVAVDGAVGAIALGIQGFERRGISEPSNEANIKGSREGFVETVRINMSLIRRRIKSPTLKFEIFQLGSVSRTDVCLCYLVDKVPKKLIGQIKDKLDKINLETILASGYVQPFLELKQGEIFNSIGSTERPDTACGKLEEGRVILIIDGTPFALIIPYIFVENFQTLDDYNSKPYYAAFIRWVKYLAFALTLLLPGLYVAIATFHPELFNITLLKLLSAAEQSAPFPLVAETIGMLIAYEIIREAGLRLPKVVGGAVSIVGGLVIGDAAVSSGLISTPLLIVVAMSVTAAFVIPSLNQPTTVLRILFVLAGGFMGLYGVSLLLAVVVINICAMEDFGIPMLAPISPFTLKSMRDVITRVGFRKMQYGNATIEEYIER